MNEYHLLSTDNDLNDNRRRLCNANATTTCTYFRKRDLMKDFSNLRITLKLKCLEAVLKLLLILYMIHQHKMILMDKRMGGRTLMILETMNATCK